MNEFATPSTYTVSLPGYRFVVPLNDTTMWCHVFGAGALPLFGGTGTYVDGAVLKWLSQLLLKAHVISDRW